MPETKTPAIVVLTGRGTETMLAEGGSQAWVIDAKRARDCQYVVCVQNHEQPYFSPSQFSAKHHTAFLVGKLAGVVAADSDNDKKRKNLLFSEYAEISIDDAWPKLRNPVHYSTLEDMGIDVTTLKFQPMPFEEVSSSSAGKAKSLTIAQAKAGLAITFGVTPADVEIVIRG